jgi:hypothetical protein
MLAVRLAEWNTARPSSLSHVLWTRRSFQQCLPIKWQHQKSINLSIDSLCYIICDPELPTLRNMSICLLFVNYSESKPIERSAFEWIVYILRLFSDINIGALIPDATTSLNTTHFYKNVNIKLLEGNWNLSLGHETSNDWTNVPT